MESLLCGLGLGSAENESSEEKASSSASNQLSAALAYITGPTANESPSISRGYDWPEPPPSSPPRQGPWPIEARAPSPAAAAWAADDLPARSAPAPAPASPTAAPRTFLVAATVRSPSDPRGRGTPVRRRPPSPVVNVRSAERRFLDEFLVMLADGFKMRKHGRRGGPKDRLVRLDGDMIVWTCVEIKISPRRPPRHRRDTVDFHKGVDGDAAVVPAVRAGWYSGGGHNRGSADLRGAPEAGERSGGSLPVADF